MRTLARCLLLLVAGCGLLALGPAAVARADVSPAISVRLVSPFTAVAAGETYQGRLEIIAGEPGELADLAIGGPGWTASLDRIPTPRSLAAGEVVPVDFTATPTDPDQRLVFEGTFAGWRLRHALDLSARNVRLMTEGGRVEPAAPWRAPPGDRTYRPEDEKLGGPRPAPPPDTRRAITVHGRFGCYRSDGAYVPAHSITVEVWDEDLVIDDLLGTTATNFDGYYEITVSSEDAGFADEPDIFVRFRLQNSRVRVYEPSSGNTYTYATGVTQNYTGTDLDLGALLPADPALHPSVFLHTNGSRGWVHDANLGYDVPACRIEWPSAAWPNCSGDGRIQMRQDFSWNDGCLWHEYGHWFDHEMASWEPFDYCNGICDPNYPVVCGHCFWCQESETIAWLEGWAQFHSYAVGAWYPGYYAQDPLDPVDAEALGQCGEGGAFIYDDPLLTEGFIAALTQDIADDAQDSHGVYGDYTDHLSGGVGAVFTVNVADNPTGSQDFLDKFADRYSGVREAFWETAANCGYELDLAPPGAVSGLASETHPIGVASANPYVSMFWNRAPDDMSGIAGYGLYVSVGGPGMPSSVMDIGDVTHHTTAALPPGSYWFNIRAVDNAGRWSNTYASYGPIQIREPDPADLTPLLVSGWDYPLVPRHTADATIDDCVVPPTLPGDVTSTYWNIFGVNQGEASTGMGFQAWLNVDGEHAATVAWPEIGPGGAYFGPNRGPVWMQAGRHSFTCRHDATDVVAEVNEANNVFGRQFVWTAPVIDAGTFVVRSVPPPPKTGGWDQVTSGPSWYNCDGLHMPAGGGWWHAMAVWAAMDAHDYDCRLHLPASSAEDGYDDPLAYSASGGPALDAVIANRNQIGSLAYDVGVLRWDGDSSALAYHAQSSILAFGDSVTVSLPANAPLLLREFPLAAEHTGPVSVTARCDPDQGDLRLRVLDATFTTGTLYDGPAVGSDWTGEDGLARVSAELPDAGWYGILIHRRPAAGLPWMEVTLEVSTTPPDLVPWTPPDWWSALTPRPTLDGTGTWCPCPDTLCCAPEATYLNVAARNLGPVTSAIPSRIFRDDVYVGWVNWSPRPPGAGATLNWDHPFGWTSGRHVLALRVDALQEIEETDETNNIHGEPWIWGPPRLAPPVAVTRAGPPIRTAGWQDVTTGEALWYNCDGLRLGGTGPGYWKTLALLPPVDADYDLRLHPCTEGAKDGFGQSLTGSYMAGPFLDYVLVDHNTVAFADHDVGVLRWTGTGDYRAQAACSEYLGSDPVGTWSPLEIPPGDLVGLTEFGFLAETYTVTLEPLAGDDLALAVHRQGTGYQNRLDAVVTASGGGPGESEILSFDVAEAAYYCLVVHRDDRGTGAAPYALHIVDTMTPVADQPVPQVTALTGAWPNPFNPRTTVAFSLSRADHARLVIYDLHGRAVRHLVDADLPAGDHTAIWHGCDDTGRRLASGVYFARLQATSGGGMAKVMLVK